MSPAYSGSIPSLQNLRSPSDSSTPPYQRHDGAPFQFLAKGGVAASTTVAEKGHGNGSEAQRAPSAESDWGRMKPHTDSTTPNGFVTPPRPDASTSGSTANVRNGAQNDAEAEQTTLAEVAKIKKALCGFLHTMSDYEKVTEAFDTLMEFARSA